MTIDILAKINYSYAKLHVQPTPTRPQTKSMTYPARADNPLANVRPSVPVRNALRLYVTGACRTKREASEAAGLHPQYLTMLTAPGGGSDHVKALLTEMEQNFHQNTVDMSHVMTYLGQKGAGRLSQLIDSQNERI